MAKTIATDVETYRRAVAFECLELGRPDFEPLTADERNALADGDLEPLAKRRAELIARELWEQNAPSDFLNAHSYGFAIQHKSRERLFKLLLPDGLATAPKRTERDLTDAELVATLAALSDSSRTAIESAHDLAQLHDGSVSVRHSGDAV